MSVEIKDRNDIKKVGPQFSDNEVSFPSVWILWSFRGFILKEKFSTNEINNLWICLNVNLCVKLLVMLSFRNSLIWKLYRNLHQSFKTIKCSGLALKVLIKYMDSVYTCILREGYLYRISSIQIPERPCI